MSEEAKTTMVRMDSLRVGDVILNNDVIVTVVNVNTRLVNGTMMVYVENGDEWGDNIHDRPETMVQLVKRADVRNEEAKPTHAPQRDFGPMLCITPDSAAIGWAAQLVVPNVQSFVVPHVELARQMAVRWNACAALADPSVVPELIATMERLVIARDMSLDAQDKGRAVLAKIKGESQ